MALLAWGQRWWWWFEMVGIECYIKALMERAAKTKINICWVYENSLSFQVGVWRRLVLFSATFQCFIYLFAFTVLTLQHFIIQIENRRDCQKVNHMSLETRHPQHDCAPTSHSEQWPFQFWLITNTVHVGFTMCAHRFVNHWCPGLCFFYPKLINDG